LHLEKFENQEKNPAEKICENLRQAGNTQHRTQAESPKADDFSARSSIFAVVLQRKAVAASFVPFPTPAFNDWCAKLHQSTLHPIFFTL
jgi:hypothetical protein